jgi:hypothetical protein
MPITAVRLASGELDWRCAWCGHDHTGHAIDPTHPTTAHLSVVCHPATGAVQGVNLAPCERCGAVETLRPSPGPWETGEYLHPDSLVGTVLDGGNVVIEHHIAGVLESGLTAEHREQARLIRALQQHPHLAAHAPLTRQLARRKDDPPDAPLVLA